MLTDSRFLWGVALGAAAAWYVCGTPAMTASGAGGHVPKGLRREGRLLRGVGQPSSTWWPFGTSKG